jgi:hypothetical protein
MGTPGRRKTKDATGAFRGFGVTAFTLDGKTGEVYASVFALGSFSPSFLGTARG